jgi:hypothetical protein
MLSIPERCSIDASNVLSIIRWLTRPRCAPVEHTGHSLGVPFLKQVTQQMWPHGWTISGRRSDRREIGS